MYREVFRAIVLLTLYVAAATPQIIPAVPKPKPPAPAYTEVSPLGDPEQKAQSVPIQVTNLTPQELAPGDVPEVSNAITIGLVSKSLAYRLIPEADFKMKDACSPSDLYPVSLLRTIRVPIPIGTNQGAYLVSICSLDPVNKNEVRLIVPVTITTRTPQLSAVDPSATKEGPVALTLFGRDLASVDDVWLSCGGPFSKVKTSNETAGSAGNTLAFQVARPDTFVRVCRLRVSAPGGPRSNDLEVHFGAAQSRAGWPRWVSLTMGLAVLGLLVGLPVGVRKAKDRNPWWLRLVTDEGARRISLSRLQLYAWVVSVVPATILLSALDGGLRTPLPNGVLAFSFISLLTAALGTYLNYERWSDGAAQARASISDLVMEFGLIHWERVIYCFGIALTLGYFFVMLFIDIGEGAEYVFDIPVWLVLLNAIFATLFLLGKIVRVRGPQLRGVEAVQGSLQLTLTGSNLSPDATFFLGREEIRPQTLDLNSDGEHKPEVILEDYSRQGFANILRFNIGLPSKTQWEETNVLSIRNPDGQMAQCKFALAVAITELPERPQQGSQIHLRGRGFHPECFVKFTGSAPSCEIVCKTVWESKSSLKLTLPQRTGPGRLVLVNPNRSSASRFVHVEPLPEDGGAS